MTELKGYEAQWVRNFENNEDPKAVEDFIKQINSNTYIWETLIKVLEAQAQGHNVVRKFNSLNWDLHTAFDKGYCKAIEDILRMIPRPEV